MNVQVSQEIIAGLAVAFVVAVTALLTFIAYLLRHIGAFSLALGSHADVNTALNAELLTVIRERKEERTAWEKERDDLKAEVAAVGRKLILAEESYNRQFTGLNAQLAQERNRRERLEEERAQWERDRVQWDADRQAWGNDRQKWELALAEAEANKRELAGLLEQQRQQFEARLAKVQDSLDGKANIKPADPEPGEGIPAEPETTEQQSEEKEGTSS